MHGELTAATLTSLTRVLCHEDYKVLRRHFRQVLVESWTVALGSVCVSLFCAPFPSFLFSLLLRYCFSIPAMTSRSPKQKWRLMPKRPTLPQKTPFSALNLFSRYANWFTYKEYHETATYLTHLACLNMQRSGLTNHTTEPYFRERPRIDMQTAQNMRIGNWIDILNKIASYVQTSPISFRK